MGKTERAILVIASITLLVAANGPSARTGAAAGGATDPHSRCDHCHVAEAAISASDEDHSTRPDARCCLACHQKIAAAGAGVVNGSGHLGAAMSIDCLSCHFQHPDGTRYRLRIDEESARVSDAELDPTSLLCLECHETFLQTEPRSEGDYTLHPVGITAPRMVDGGTGAPELPLADIHDTPDSADDIIACMTCHFQHGSPNPDLLRWSEEQMVAACTLCHWNGEESAAENLVATRGS